MSNALKNAGSRFPFINLQKSVERAKLLFEADQRGREVAVPAAFAVWGYSEKSSGGFQTIAALKGYGLLKESADGDSRKVALSEEGLRYFRDERPEEKVKLLKQFALKPKLIAALWADWGGTPPADTIARSHLKTEVGLNDQSARSLLAIYKENIAFSELKGGDKPLEISPEIDDDSDDPRLEAEVGDLVQVEIDGTLQLTQPGRVRAIQDHEGVKYVFLDGSETGIPMEQVLVEQKGAGGQKADQKPPTLALPDVPPPKGTRKEIFALDEGDVVLTFPESLSATSFEDLDAYLKVFISKMRRRATSEKN